MAAMFRDLEECREIKNAIDLNLSALPESSQNGSHNPTLFFPSQIQRQGQGLGHRRISAASNKEDTGGIVGRDLSLKPSLLCKDEPLELPNSHAGNESPWLPNKLRLFRDFQFDSNFMPVSNPKDNGHRPLPKSVNPNLNLSPNPFRSTNALDFMKASTREESSLLPDNRGSIFGDGSAVAASSSSTCKANTREFMNPRSRDGVTIASLPPHPFCNGNTREFMTVQSREAILANHKHNREEEEGIVTIAGSIGNGNNTREFLKVQERPTLEEGLARPFCNGNGGGGEFKKVQIREAFLLPNQRQRSVLEGGGGGGGEEGGVSSFCNGNTLELMKAPSVTAELVEAQSREMLLPDKLRLFQDFLGQKRSVQDEKSISNDALVSNMELSSLSIGGGGGPSFNAFQHGDGEQQHPLEQSNEALLPNKLRLFQDFMAKQPPPSAKRRRSRSKASSLPQKIPSQEQYGSSSMPAAGSAVERWYLDEGESSQAPVGGVPLFADRILEQYQRRLDGTSDINANLVSGSSEYLSMRARKERAGRNRSFPENLRSKNKLQTDPLANTTTPIFLRGGSYKDFLAPKQQPGKQATDPYIIVEEEPDDNNQDKDTPQTDVLARKSRDFLSEGFTRRNGQRERSFIMQELDELAAKNPWGLALHGQNTRDNDALGTDSRNARDFPLKESDIWNQESLVTSVDRKSSTLKESCSRDLLKLGNLSRELPSDRQCNAEGETDIAAVEMSIGNCQQPLLQNQQDDAENPLLDGMRGLNKDMMEECNKDAQSDDAYASKQIESPSWLPPGWITISKLRKAGSTAGTTDKYYINPATGRRFRSKNEVMRFLDTGQLNRTKQNILDVQMLDSSALALATRKEWMNDPSLYPDMSRDHVLGKQQSDDRFGGSNPITTELCVEGSSRIALAEGSNATQNYHMEAFEGQANHFQSKLLQESGAKTTMPLYLLPPFVDPKDLLLQRFHQLDERQLYFRNAAKPILFSSAKAKESTGVDETCGKLWNSAVQQGKRSSSTLTGMRKQQKLNPKFERELLVVLGRKLCQQSLGRAAQTSGTQGS